MSAGSDLTWARFLEALPEVYLAPIVTGGAAGLVLGFLGVYVVLRRMVFISAALSQVSSVGVALAFWLQIHAGATGLLGEPVLLALLLALLATLLFRPDPARLHLSRDSLLGLVYVLAGVRVAAPAGAVVVVLLALWPPAAPTGPAGHHHHHEGHHAEHGDAPAEPAERLDDLEEHLAEIERCDDPGRCSKAIHALGHHGDPATVPLLVRRLSHEAKVGLRCRGVRRGSTCVDNRLSQPNPPRLARAQSPPPAPGGPAASSEALSPKLEWRSCSLPAAASFT